MSIESPARFVAYRHRRVGVVGDTTAEHVRKALADCIAAGDVAAGIQCRAQSGGAALILCLSVA
jgi:hypothetical protein